MIGKFGDKFPSTKVFSEFARSTVTEISSSDNPDAVVLAWLAREEILFRTFERHLVGDRLREGFTDDVDAFIKFSLHVQNRRKSRAGHSLEHHLEPLFVQEGIHYTRTAITEGRSKPDYLFPGNDEYHNADFSAALLSMLGVKTSCKDRWRQVLTEADRIDHKHLFTLEPGISSHQTAEMQRHKLQLVLPAGIHSSYTPEQRDWLMNFSAFIGLVKERQDSARNTRSTAIT